MRALIFLVAIVLLLALAGWITFSGRPGRSSINIETQKIQADTDRALESGAGLIKRASDSVQTNTVDPNSVAPSVEEPIPQTAPIISTPDPATVPQPAPAHVTQ